VYMRVSVFAAKNVSLMERGMPTGSGFPFRRWVRTWRKYMNCSLYDYIKRLDKPIERLG
jgi:hypothetical protein